MTSPLQLGYPDWNRTSAEADVLEINDQNATYSGTHTYPIRYVGTAKALFLHCNPTSQSIQVQLTYFADSGGTVTLDTYRLDLQQNDVARQPIPILGPYMQVTTTAGAGGNYSATLLVWRIPALGYMHGDFSSRVMFSADGAAVGGLAQTRLNVSDVLEGPAIWTVGVTGGNWVAAIACVDWQGNETIIDRVDNTGAAFAPRIVHLPPWHIRAIIVNNNAAAQTYELFMTRQHNR